MSRLLIVSNRLPVNVVKKGKSLRFKPSAGGLATGLDTNAIVDQLMAIERMPITRMETDKTWFQSRQTAYASFDDKLKSFLSSIENLGSSDDLRQKSISASSEDFFSVSLAVPSSGLW